MASSAIVVPEGLEKLYLASIRGELLLRIRWGIVVAVAFDATLILWGPGAFPTLDATSLRAPMLAALGSLLGTLALTAVRGVERHAVLLLAFLSFQIAWAVGEVASRSGGYESPFLQILSLIWVFGAAISPLSPLQFLLSTVPDLPITAAFIERGSTTTGSFRISALVLAGGYIYCLVGVILRHRSELAAFAGAQRLAEAKRALELSELNLRSLNGELEARVLEQVGEVQRRATEIELLNVQLQQRVRERSEELAAALQRLGENPVELGVGAVLGERYELLTLVGEGGMGRVYRAKDRASGSICAIKLLRRAISGEARSQQRLLLEAATAARVSHRGIVRTLDVDVTRDGHLYLVLEYVEGVSLAHALRSGVMTLGEQCRLGAAVATALAAAHAAGIVHRDVKPSNILLVPGDGGIKLVDFGLAKFLTSEARKPGAALTRADEVVGTPTYFSPEQAESSAHVGPPSDVYSLAVVLFEMISGQRPFDADSDLQWLFAHVTKPPLALNDVMRDVPDALSEIIAACLRKRPETRPSASELASALELVAAQVG